MTPLEELLARVESGEYPGARSTSEANEMRRADSMKLAAAIRRVLVIEPKYAGDEWGRMYELGYSDALKAVRKELDG